MQEAIIKAACAIGALPRPASDEKTAFEKPSEIPALITPHLIPLRIPFEFIMLEMIEGILLLDLKMIIPSIVIYNKDTNGIVICKKEEIFSIPPNEIKRKIVISIKLRKNESIGITSLDAERDALI